MVRESLVSISEASHLLGVSEAALRQWTDERMIKAFITPGGHRRYSKADLTKFMSSRQKMLNVKDLAVELKDTARLHREIGRTYLNTTSWYNNISEASQEHLAHLGRHLLSLIIKYVTEPSKRDGTIKLAYDSGHDLGETLARLGLPLTASVEAFTQHREPIMNAITHLMRKRDVLTSRILEAIPLVDQAMDEALIALVAAHQQFHDEIKKREKQPDDINNPLTL